MLINTQILKDESKARRWQFTEDDNGWCLMSRGATASYVERKTTKSPELIPADDYPRLYVNGNAEAVLELIWLVAACEVEAAEG